MLGKFHKESADRRSMTVTTRMQPHIGVGHLDQVVVIDQRREVDVIASRFKYPRRSDAGSGIADTGWNQTRILPK